MPQLDNVAFYHVTFWFLVFFGVFYTIIYLVIVLPLVNNQKIALVNLYNRIYIIINRF